MNQDTMLTLRRRAIGVAVASALAALCSGNAFADPVMTARLFRDTDILFRDADMSRWSDNYVELGVGNNTQPGYRFGQFSGLKDKGGFPIAGFNWLSRDSSNDARYWHVFGSTLASRASCKRRWRRIQLCARHRRPTSTAGSYQ
jgi:hypothetical protein